MISGPGHWEDLESGLCDTCISAQSLEAAIAAAAIVCHAVDAVHSGRLEGFRAEVDASTVVAVPNTSSDDITKVVEVVPASVVNQDVEMKAIKSEPSANEFDRVNDNDDDNDIDDNDDDDDNDSDASLQSFDSTILRKSSRSKATRQQDQTSRSDQMLVDGDESEDKSNDGSNEENSVHPSRPNKASTTSTAAYSSIDLVHAESWVRHYGLLVNVCEKTGTGNLLFKQNEQFEDGSTAKLGRWICDQRR